MKTKLQMVAKFLAIAIITFVFTAQFNEVLEEKTSTYTYNTFKKNGYDYDVLFVGASHVTWSIYPLDLKEKYGISSYNIALEGAYPEMWYWIVKEALKYSAPKLIVIDPYLMTREIQLDNNASLHQMLDVYPLDLDKVQAVMEFDEDYVRWGTLDKVGVLLKFPDYHTRIRELTQSDFEADDFVNEELNIVRNDTVISGIEFNDISRTSEVTDDYNNSMGYIEKTVKLCRDNGIEVLLAKTPNPSNEESMKYYNWCYALADKYDGVEYVDMDDTDVLLQYYAPEQLYNYKGFTQLLDYSTDVSASSGTAESIKAMEDQSGANQKGIYDNIIHVNTSGAAKITDFVGRYLTENYSGLI